MIRHADLRDVDQLMNIMVAFANEAPLLSLNIPQYDEFRAKKLLTYYMGKGVLLVSERDNVLTGILIAGLIEDLWLPQVKQLREIAWYVLPEYRQSTDGYRLLKKYEEIGKRLKAQNKISDVVITTMVTSPVDISKRGWKQIEQNYILSEEV